MIKALFSQMSELMISPSVLDLDGGFEDIENMGVLNKGCGFTGAC